MGKLDPRAMKCVFRILKRDYVCWSPMGIRLFVSMDVTFWEHETYHSSVKSHLGDSLDSGGMKREGRVMIVVAVVVRQ